MTDKIKITESSGAVIAVEETHNMMYLVVHLVRGDDGYHTISTEDIVNLYNSLPKNDLIGIRGLRIKVKEVTDWPSKPEP